MTKCITGNWKTSLELEAVFFCLKAFCKSETRLYVLLNLDNITDVAYINKKYICNWTKGQNVWIITLNIPGIKSTIADLRLRDWLSLQ